MKKQIKGKLLLIALLSMALTLVLSVAVFYGVFEDQVKRNLRQSGALMQAGLERVPDTALLEAYARSGFWVALMDENGDVLFEDGAGAEGAENHLDRPEVEQALRQGHGEAVRPGGAPGRHVYYSAARLSDGRVLWVAREALGIAPFYKQAIPWLAVIVAVLAVLSVRLAALLTKRLVEPIEAMAENIDEIEKRVPYAELEPFAVAVKEYHLRRQETERIRQEFTANVSHELKTPLTSISGYAEMIENGMAKPEDVEEFAGKIGLEASRLINLIGDIIQLSEVDDPVAHQGSFTRVDLLAVAQRTMESLKINADMNHITLCATGRHLEVQGNEGLLEELVRNLCDNAIRYNNPGGRVTIQVGEQEGRVCLTVRDTGIGIPPEHHGRIFERFYRVDRSRSKGTGGTGLGLAIVKHVAIHHNAKITVTSAEGAGTEIAVRFPPTQGT